VVVHFSILITRH